MGFTQIIGTLGEDAAANYLRKKGYIIKKRNFRLKTGEIDIIAADPNGCTVFVEVKARKGTAYGNPSEFVDRRKQEKIRRTALIYMRTDQADMRFDIIEVLYKVIGDTPRITKINHIENAF